MVKGTIGIAKPDHFVIPYHFAQSLINVIRHCDKIWEPGSVKLQIVEGSLVEENRIALLALAEGDWLLMLDTDMTFPHDIAETLDKHIQDGKDLVSGLYFLGYEQVSMSPALYSPQTTDRTPAVRYADYPKDSVFEIGGCGGGCMMIGKKIIDDFKENNQVNESFRRMWKMGVHVGEDLSFCYRVRDKGYKLWCDSTVKAGHLRPYALTETQGFIKP